MDSDERQIFKACNPVLLLFDASLTGLNKSPELLSQHSLIIKLYKGIMCQVLHMARCTNVATFEILPLTSEVGRGNYKRMKKLKSVKFIK